MFSRLSVLFCLGVMAVAGKSVAAGLPSPTVEYSADRIVETEAGTFSGKVYSAQGKERSETDMGGMQSVIILRRDKQLGWMLMPSHKMYQQLDLLWTGRSMTVSSFLVVLISTLPITYQRLSQS